MTDTLEDRFWRQVVRSATCWEWTGVRTAKGYGRVSIAGRYIYVHRVSWEWHRGPIPPGLLVLHHCDNPPCVRPDHLWLGTMLDNVRDMDSKGRRKSRGLMERCHRGHLMAENFKVSGNGRYCGLCDRRRRHNKAVDPAHAVRVG